jgi:hypothetical protein
MPDEGEYSWVLSLVLGQNHDDDPLEIDDLAVDNVRRRKKTAKTPTPARAPTRLSPSARAASGHSEAYLQATAESQRDFSLVKVAIWAQF